MSIPIMLATFGLEVSDLVRMSDLTSYLPALMAGIVTAGLVGFLAIRWLLGYLAKHTLYIFSIYCIIAAAIVLIIQYV
jgi:undecaprenyl-diphosphatase